MRKLSRRGVFATAAAVAVAGTSATGAQGQTPQASSATSREEDLASARAAIQNSSAALARVKLPIATEPAFVFKAF